MKHFFFIDGLYQSQTLCRKTAAYNALANCKQFSDTCILHACFPGLISQNHLPYIDIIGSAEVSELVNMTMVTRPHEHNYI